MMPLVSFRSCSVDFIGVVSYPVHPAALNISEIPFSIVVPAPLIFLVYQAFPTQ